MAINLQGTNFPLTYSSAPQGGINVQGTGGSIQVAKNAQPAGGITQSNANASLYADPESGAPSVQGLNTAYSTGDTGYDPAAAQAAAQAAADAARAAQLRTNITDLVNNIKGIFDTRYGLADTAAADQSNTLNTRFGTESKSVNDQVTQENQNVGAGYSGRGTFDSSYRANDQDTVAKAGANQVQGLFQELQDNLNKIGSWLSSQHASFGAQKSGLDTVLSHLGEETDPNALAQIRAQLEGRISDLQAQGSDYNTQTQNRSALEAAAPSAARTVQLQTVLSNIISGSASPAFKKTVGVNFIAGSDLPDQQKQQLTSDFLSQLGQTA